LGECLALSEEVDGKTVRELYVLANGINSVANTRGKVFKLVPLENAP
jgi:hypothetical protein